MASEAPELTNFGSLIRFAVGLEAATSTFYEAAANLRHSGGTPGLFDDLGTQHANRRQLLERTRQRSLNEIVLEPITALDGRRYVYDASTPPRSQVIARALALEAVAARFYEDSSVVAQALLTEAARTLHRLAEENRKNVSRLEQDH